MPRKEHVTQATQLVLSAFLEAGDREIYGMELAKTTGLQHGTIYPILARQVERGRLIMRQEEADPKIKGRPLRRYYRMTEEGKRYAEPMRISLPGGKGGEIAHRYLPTPVYILKAEIDHDRMDCCDDDPRKVWVVTSWSLRRAVLTHAEPFLEAAGTTDVMSLEGKHFMTRIDLGDPPPFEHEGGERLEWPELRLAPSMEEVCQRLGIKPPPD